MAAAGMAEGLSKWNTYYGKSATIKLWLTFGLMLPTGTIGMIICFIAAIIH